MTALEYMERQLYKHKMNYQRAFHNGSPQNQLDNIADKIRYYQDAVDAIRMVTDNGKI